MEQATTCKIPDKANTNLSVESTTGSNREDVKTVTNQARCNIVDMASSALPVEVYTS
jgi:acetolactate synthase small subunit